MPSQPTSPSSSLTPYSSVKMYLSESKRLELSQQSRVKYLKTMLDEARMKNQQANMAFQKTVQGQDNLDGSHKLLEQIKSRRDREAQMQKEKNMELKTKSEQALERSKSSLERMRQSNYERERLEYIELKDRKNELSTEHLQNNQQKRNNVAKEEEERRQKELNYSSTKQQEFEMQRAEDSVEMQRKSQRFDSTRETLEEEEKQLLNEIERVKQQTQELEAKVELRQRSRSNSMRGSK